MHFITSLVAITILAGQTYGHPAFTTAHEGHTKRIVDFNLFRLNTLTNYTNVRETSDSFHARSLATSDSYIDTAAAFLESIAPDANFRLADDHYVGTNGIGHVNFKQTVHGLDIDNADVNINVS